MNLPMVRCARHFPLAACVLVAAATAFVPVARAGEVSVSPATTAAEAGLVDVRTLAPDIALDMRYAGWHNFTARPVPGYEAPTCPLLAPVAQALAKVQAGLRAEGYSLLMFDCYRPVRAVKAFVDWAADPADQANKAEFYPDLDKARIIPDGYVAEVSAQPRRHRRSGPARLPQGLHGAGHGHRLRPFGLRAHTDAPGLGEVQRAHRRQLLAGNGRQAGFVNYPNEWWHYTFQPEPAPTIAYDVPVR
jgi:D-alanyl-D-alanine dipeptidase